MEHQEQGLVLLCVDLLLGIGLVLAEEFRVQANVAGLVHAVDIAESSGNGEVWGDGSESLVYVVNVLGLSVECGVVNT